MERLCREFSALIPSFKEITPVLVISEQLVKSRARPSKKLRFLRLSSKLFTPASVIFPQLFNKSLDIFIEEPHKFETERL